MNKERQRHRTAAIIASVIIALSLTGQAEKGKGQAEGAQEGEATARKSEFVPRLLSANPLIGADVTNREGEELGEIEDIVFNAQRNRISYAALGFGGALGIGEKYFAIPWNALDIQTTGSRTINQIVLNVRQKDLKAAQGFDTDNWPDHGDPRWTAGVTQEQKYHAEQHETTARGATSREMRFRRLTEIVGVPVKNLEGRELGDVENIIVDLHEGRPVYAVLGFGGFLGLGEKMATIPWSSVEVLPRLETARVDVSKSVLETIAYEQGSEPDLARVDRAEQLYRRFDEDPYWEVFGYVKPSKPEEQAPSNEAWKSQSKYNAHYDQKTVVTKKGTVQSVGTFHPAPNTTPGLRLQIRTDDGETTTVYAGPRDYAAKNGFQFHYGDQLKVTGSRVKVHDRTVIMATRIQRGDNTLELRSGQGRPNWSEDLD